MSQVSVYCTYNAFSEIFMFPDAYPELYALIERHANLTLDLDDPTLAQTMKEDPFLKGYFKQQSKIDNDPECFLSFAKEDYQYGSHAGQVLIIEQSVDSCNEIGRNYGVLALSAKNLNDTSLNAQRYHSWSWGVAERKDFCCSFKKNYSGWSGMIKPVTEKYLPSVTTIIINDDYLLAKSDNKIISENIFSIVQGFAPSTRVSLNLEVLIIAGDSKTTGSIAAIDYSRLDKIVSKLNSLSASLSPLSIKYGILTHPIEAKKFGDFHKRFIITDYAICSSEHGFIDFDNGIATMENDLNYEWAFCNLNNTVGADIPLKKIKRKLDAIRALRDSEYNFPSTYFRRGHLDIRLLKL